MALNASIFSLILNNQRGSLDLGSEGTEEHTEADSGGEDLSNEGLLESINLESQSESESESENEGTTEGEEKGAGPTPENEGDDLEAQLLALKSEDNPEANKLLEELNQLGILHKGLPVEFDDMEKVKEQLSKGFDYTQKTQELAEERKTHDAELSQERETFATERENFQTEIAQHEKSLNNYGIFQNMVADIQAKDPELFEELNHHYMNHETQAQQSQNNPEVNALKEQVAKLTEQIGGNANSEESKMLGDIKESWQTDVTALQASIGPQLRSLGIKPDWNKVQEVWKADATNSLSVKAALFAQHGEQITKAMANKNKLAETRAKVARSGSSTQDDNNEKVFGMTSGNSYENEAFEILKDL